MIEKAFVRAYNALCTYDGEFINGFLEHVKEGLQDSDIEKEMKSINKKIARLKDRKSSLVDMRLDDSIDEETYQIKVAEVNERLDDLLSKKKSLNDRKKDQQDINKRLTEFQKVISNNEVLRNFDRYVFESVVDRVIVGEKSENGEINPYKLRFIFKTGHEREEVASKQPFSFGNPYSHTDSEYGIISLHSDDDTCGSRVLSTSGEFVEVLNFRHFARYMSFTPTGKQGKKKQIMNGIEVSVVLHLV